MAAYVNDVALYNEDYHALKNTSVVCAGSASYVDDESSFQSDTCVEGGHYGGSVQSFYMEDSVYQEQQQDQLDTIAFIRTEMRKLRQQLLVRKEAEYVLLQRVTYMDHQNSLLKEEIAHLRNSNNYQQSGQGPVVVQLNLSSQQQMQQSLVQDQNIDNLRTKQNEVIAEYTDNCETPSSAAIPVHNDCVPLRDLSTPQTDESHSQFSATNSQPDLELQVHQLMMELESAENAASIAQNKESVLQQHIVSMSDKVMCLNSQVEQLHTKLAVQQQEAQSVQQELLQQLEQRDLQLEKLSLAFNQRGDVAAASGEHALDNQSSDLQQLSFQSGFPSTSLHITQQSLEQQQHKTITSTQHDGSEVNGVPSLRRIPKFMKQHVWGLQLMLFLNSFMHAQKSQKLEQHVLTKQLQQDKQLSLQQGFRRRRRQVSVPLLNFRGVDIGGTSVDLSVQSERCQEQDPKTSFWVNSEIANKVKKQSSDRYLDLIINGNRDSSACPADIILSAKLSSEEGSRCNVLGDMEDSQIAGQHQQLQQQQQKGVQYEKQLCLGSRNKSSKQQRGRFVKLVFMLSSIGIAVPKLINSIRSGVSCAVPTEARTISFTSTNSAQSASSPQPNNHHMD